MPQTAVRTCLAAVLLCVALPRAHADNGDFFFKPEDRILFLGDSITMLKILLSDRRLILSTNKKKPVRSSRHGAGSGRGRGAVRRLAA
jgi:hypothetical protein